MKRPRIFKLVSLCLLSALLALQIHAKPLRIFGSDLFANWLSIAFEDDLNVASDGIHFSLSGSYGGLIAIENGYADGCLYLQSDSTLPTLPEGFESTTIAYYVIYLYAPSSFPQREISKSTILSIASATNTQSALTWESVLNTPAAWAEQLTHVTVESGVNDITASLFKYSFVKSQPCSDRVTFVDDTTSLEEALSEKNYFILVTDQCNPPVSSMKSIALADFEDNFGFTATADNIKFGDYSACFPIQLIYPTSAKWPEFFIQKLKETELQGKLLEHNILPQY